MARHNAVMSKVTVSEESHTANSRTVRSIVGLICSGTETSKHSAIPVIEKGDALATSCAYGLKPSVQNAYGFCPSLLIMAQST